MASLLNFTKHVRKQRGGKRTWKTKAEEILPNSFYEVYITLLQTWNKDDRRKRPIFLTTTDTKTI